MNKKLIYTLVVIALLIAGYFVYRHFHKASNEANPISTPSNNETKAPADNQLENGSQTTIEPENKVENTKPRLKQTTKSNNKPTQNQEDDSEEANNGIVTKATFKKPGVVKHGQKPIVVVSSEPKARLIIDGKH